MAERFEFSGRTETLLALESALALAGWSGIHELLSELRERHPSRCTDVDLAAAGVITVKPEGDWWVAQFRSSSLHAANAAAERLATSSAAATVGAPEGHRVAPLSPTVEMEVAGFECAAWDALSDAVLQKKGWPYSCRESAECVRAIYQAMLAAAPGTAEGHAPGDSQPAPEVTLRIERHMLSTPKPIGVGVFHGKRLVGVCSLDELRNAAAQATAPAPGTATFGALKAVTAEKNKLNRALELACGYLTEAQVAEIAALMPEGDFLRAPAVGDGQ